MLPKRCLFVGEEDDQRLLMKCLPADNQKTNGPAKEIDPLVRDTIVQLLNSLVDAHLQELLYAAAHLDDESPQGMFPILTLGLTY